MPYGKYRAIELPTRLNVTTELLDLHLDAESSDRVALFNEAEKVSYELLHTRVCQFSSLLQELDVRREERVALILRDRPEFHYAFLGALRAGCQAVPINTMLTIQDYAYMLDDSAASVLVVEADLLDIALSIRDSLPNLRHILIVAEEGVASDLPSGCSLLSPALDQSKASFAPASTGRDEPAYWLYSSGSTGAPKAAVHLHKDPIYAAEHFGRGHFKLTSSDVIFSAPRLFFAYGLGNSLYIPLRIGASVGLVAERPTPEVVFSTIEWMRPTVFFFVPTGYVQMLAFAESAGRDFDLNSIRIAMTGGEPLSRSLFDRWKKRFGIELVEGWGSSEANHMIIVNPLDAIRPGSCGRVVDGFEARVVDEGDRECPPGETGVLEVKGGCVAAYYWGKQDKTREAFQGWWLRTGDQFYADEDEYFWFVGRNDDMIKAGGIWVSPAEVESVLCEREEVLEAGVAGVKDQDGLAKPVAFVVLKAGGGDESLAEDLREHVRSRLAHYKVPREVVFIDELPKTATGKIRRFKLREQGP